jgi:hypothetical protein
MASGRPGTSAAQQIGRRRQDGLSVSCSASEKPDQANDRITGNHVLIRNGLLAG